MRFFVRDHQPVRADPWKLPSCASCNTTPLYMNPAVDSWFMDSCRFRWRGNFLFVAESSLLKHLQIRPYRHCFFFLKHRDQNDNADFLWSLLYCRCNIFRIWIGMECFAWQHTREWLVISTFVSNMHEFVHEGLPWDMHGFRYPFFVQLLFWIRYGFMVN